MNNLNIIRAATPGTPNIPAIKAVTTLIPMENPNLAPTKLTMYKRTTPNIPFSIIFNGHLNIFSIINNTIMATMP